MRHQHTAHSAAPRPPPAGYPSRNASRRPLLHLGSARVQPSDAPPGPAASSSSGTPPGPAPLAAPPGAAPAVPRPPSLGRGLGVKSSAMLPASAGSPLALALAGEEAVPVPAVDGHATGSTLRYVKALMSLKHEVDLSWEAKRAVIGAIADNALASFVLINLALKRCVDRGGRLGRAGPSAEAAVLGQCWGIRREREGGTRARSRSHGATPPLDPHHVLPPSLAAAALRA
jgi:hypothetical protein